MAECDGRNVALLEGSFAIYPKTIIEYHVLVTNSEISYATSNESSTQVIKFSDVVGADCMRGKTANCHAAYLNIYAYPHRKKFASSGSIRQRRCITIVFAKFPSFEENHKDAQQWQLVITYLVRKIEVKPEDIPSLRPLAERRLLVLVNPFSGTGKALHMFQRHVVPLFAEAGLQYQLVVTERPGHAGELVKELVLTDWYGIVVVSGDGLIFEVINGLMERADWPTAIKTPIGVIPGGSANAYASSVAYSVGEPYLEKPVLHAAFMLAKHTVVPMDLCAVDTCTGKRLYSFVCVEWGIVADVDIESEKYRSLGKARFTLGTVTRLVGLRSYRGRVSFRPVDEYQPRMVRHSSAAAEPQLETNSHAPASLDHAIVGGDSVDSANPRTPDGSAWTDLPPLSSAVPPDWVMVEGDFVGITAMYVSHLSQDVISVHNSTLDDSIIYLSMIRAPMSRLRLLKVYMAMQSGTDLTDPGIERIPVNAFRLEPLGPQQGNMVVDGELVDYGPIQAQVLPSMARVMSLAEG